MDRTSTAVLYIRFWLGAFRWLPQPDAGRMRSSVPEVPIVQHGSNYRIFLDPIGGPLHSVRRHLQNGLRHAKEIGG